MDAAVGAVVGGVVHEVYRRTMYASVPGGDAGELIAEACQFGVAHPPGYPLYVWLTHAALRAFTWLPKPAARANYASVLCATAAAVGVYAVTLHVCNGGGSSWRRWSARACAAMAAALFAASPLTWTYSTGAEVFALNNALVACVLWCLVAYVASPSGRSASWTAAACGLALSNQHTALFFAAPAAAWVAVTEWVHGRVSVAAVARHASAFGVGLLPYAHLPLAHSLWRGVGSWGDASTVSGFLRHFLRQDYGTFKLLSRADATAEPFLQRSLAYVRDALFEQAPHPVAVAAPVAALVACWLVAAAHSRGSPPPPAGGGRERNVDNSLAADGGGAGEAVQWSPAPSLAVAACMATYLLAFHSLSNMPLSDRLLFGVHARFWMQPNLALAVLVGAGVHGAGVALARTTHCGKRGGVIAPAVSCLVAGAVLAAVAARAFRIWPAMDQSDNDVLEQYGRALLEPLPTGAALVTGYDMQWTSTRYLQTCEGLRSDVVLLNAPVMSFDWFRASQRLYPSMRWPGSHLQGQLTPAHAAGAFSLADLLIVNSAPDGGHAYMQSYNDRPPHASFVPRMVNDGACAPRSPCAVPIHYTGLMQFGDRAHERLFDLVPRGIAGVFLPRTRDALLRANHWSNVTMLPGAKPHPPPPHTPTREDVVDALSAWRTVERTGAGRVDPQRYDATTWELATRIDFWSQAASFATWLLETSLNPEVEHSPLSAAPRTHPHDEDYCRPAETLMALRLLEEAAVAMPQHGATPDAMLNKNLGLGYLRLVRTKQPVPATADLRTLLQRFNVPPTATAQHDGGWGSVSDAVAVDAFRTWAAERVLATWSAFAASPAAGKDAGIATIRRVVEVLTAAAARRTVGRGRY